ncbi:vWA domain-containing protein [Neobacillus sp. LXY-1]|uniref:vWA domain-containing protein n=1 Tax=Neobacillus sp. LXY-1 TaxID=3379133 RepID=UPI003EE24443
MSFASPYYFFLLVLIALVILLYFFRKQYMETTISAHFLWQQVMNEWEASPWLKKLQHNMLFWLQIIALTLLMFALVRPFWVQKGMVGDHVIWIVDTSASMSAEGEHGSIFEQSKEKMLKLSEQMNGQDLTLIQAGAKPKLLLNGETDESVIRKRIQALKVTYEHEDFTKAVKLADSLVSKDRTVIHVFSDAVKKDELADIFKSNNFEIHNIQGKKENISILSFGVARNDQQISGLAVIENQSQQSKPITFYVKNKETSLFEKKITVPPGKQIMVDVPNLPEYPFYQAGMEVDDSYQVDNQQTAVFTEQNPTVYVLGDINPFFIKGLHTLNIPTIQLTEWNKSSFHKSGILVAESTQPDQLPNLPAIILNKNNRVNKVDVKAPLVAKKSPLTEYVEMEKTYIKQAVPSLKGNFENVVTSGDIPLIQTGGINGHPVIVMNFSLNDSDWPLHPGFPIFLYNSYQWLAKQTDFLGYFQPGEEKWLQLKQGSDKLEVFNESGNSVDSIDILQKDFKAPLKPGIYQAVSKKQLYYFSVLLDDREKHPEYAKSVSLKPIDSKKNSLKETKNDFSWFWLALLSFIVLMTEWEVYRRGFRV